MLQNIQPTHIPQNYSYGTACPLMHRSASKRVTKSIILFACTDSVMNDNLSSDQLFYDGIG